MKYLMILGIAAIVFLGVGATCKKSSQTNQAVQSTNSVSISNFSFNPQNISVKKGTEVTWTNNDSTTHTVTFDTFQSGDVAPGSTFKHTFTSTGTFNYHCSIHPSMTGEVVVQ